MYHYSNFEEVYAEFDRDNNYLLDPVFIVKDEDLLEEQNQNSKPLSGNSGVDPALDQNYESKCYLRNFGISKLNKLFKKLR